MATLTRDPSRAAALDPRLRIVEDRPVASAMTATVPHVSPDTEVRLAEWVVVRSGLRHLPVMKDGRLVGLVTASDLRAQPPDTRVASCMNERVVTIRPNATLADAAALMNERAIDCLPVMSGGVLLGLVTRVHLRRAGLSGDQADGPVCAACHRGEHVRLDPRTRQVPFCLDCLERAHEEVESGGGD